MIGEYPASQLLHTDGKKVGAADIYFTVNATFRFIEARLATKFNVRNLLNWKNDQTQVDTYRRSVDRDDKTTAPNPDCTRNGPNFDQASLTLNSNRHEPKTFPSVDQPRLGCKPAQSPDPGRGFR